ncbi:NLR family CARD domain-containing protein 3 isoform X1 [Paramormyrops kingsleyae]|uniref:NLR family CARD domain-containing protein 3 isoform X1 n=2 Tax=Paramormyrops kingsleyae TaxID=1676925 RepID=UPI003B97063E
MCQRTAWESLRQPVMAEDVLKDFVLDGKKRIPWEEDCYIDLQSESCSPRTKMKMEELWIHKHRKQLLHSVSGPLLDSFVGHMHKVALLTQGEASQLQSGGQLQEKLCAVIDILASKGPQGSDMLQEFIENTDTQLYGLITLQEPIMQKHGEALQSCCSGWSTGLLSGSWAADRFSTLLLVEGLTDLQQKEHDVLQTEATKGSWRHNARQLSLDKLLNPLTRVSMPPRILLTVGVAGIGKTTLVRQFLQLWNSGKIYQDVSFVFLFSFWELNTYEKLSAERLVRLFYPHVTDMSYVFNDTTRVLIIFDGLDEFKCSLDFSDALSCMDPKKDVPVDNLITNIIRGNIFPEASIWLTSRPNVAAQIPGGLVDRMTEIPGLKHEDIQKFLFHMFQDRSLADQIWCHIKAYKIFLVMCYVPCVCWIVGSTLGFLIKGEMQDCLPRTWTELYSYFLKMIVEGESKDREPLKIEQSYGSSRRLIGSLGKLAFYGLIKRKYTFYEQDMKAYGIDLPSLQSHPCSRLLIKEESVTCTAYNFTHLTVQEFLSATFYYTASKRAIFDLFTESGMSWPKIGFNNHFKSALQRSQQSECGQLDMFVRFLSGMLSPLVAKPLSGLQLLAKEENSAYRAPAITFLQSLLSGGSTVSLWAVNVVHCLQELQHTELTRNVEEGLRTGSLAGKLSASTCSILAYLLQMSEECAEETNLSGCLTYSVVKSLLPQLLFCSNLRLENNHFKDDVMELLGSLLSAKDCHLQRISLAENAVSNKGTKAISRSLLVNRSLTSLDLRSNNIGPKGAKSLAEALKNNQVLVSISLQNNVIEDEGTKALAEVLLCNRKLTTLHLQKNSIGSEGARSLAGALQKNQVLRELSLSSNQLGDKGSEALAQALMVNHSLITLHLQSNSISNKGVTALTKALKINRGLADLNLRENSIGVEGAKEIAKALQTNGTLKNLDLTANLLHDEGAKAIAKAVQFNCALTSLHLQWNFIRSTAAQALAAALTTNTALQLLDLQENAIGDEGMIALAEALQANTALGTLFLQGVSVGRRGAVALAEALCSNRSLHTLDLRGNSIGMEGAKALANALKANSSLRVLNLQENALGMDGAIFIATALNRSHQLTYINLQGNRIGDSGAKVISDTIKTRSPECVVKI